MKCAWLILAALVSMFAMNNPARAWGWTNDPWTGFITVAGTSANEQYPLVSSLAEGRTFIAWYSEGANIDSGMMHYQVLDQFGNGLLPANGLQLVEGAWINYGEEILPDGQGGCITAFMDKRDGTRDIWGQRVDNLGNRLWGSAGLPLVLWPGANEDATPRDLTCDSLGNYYLTWLRYGTIYPHYSFYYVLKFTADGIPLWGPYGVQFRDSSLEGGAWPKSVPDGMGGLFEVWQDNRFNTAPATLPYLYMQHINAQGQPLWTANGAPVRLPGGSSLQAYLYQGVPDGSGGSVWTSANLGSAHIWRLDSQGNMVWLWTSSNGPWVWAYNLLRHPLTGTVWGSRDMQDGYHLYGFNVQTGQSLFGPNGLPYGGAVVPTSDGVISTLCQEVSLPAYVYSRRVDSTGDLQWFSYIAMENQGWGFTNPVACNNGSDGAVITFQDQRFFWSGHYNDISAQQINADGTIGTPFKIKLPSKPTPLSLTPGQISFTLEQAGPIQLDLFDILGRKVASLESGFLQAGSYTYSWEDRFLPSGIYLLKLNSAEGVQVAKTLIIH